MITADQLDELITDAWATHDKLDQIDETLESTKSDAEILTEIAEVVAKELVPEWLNLAPQLSRHDTWQVLERALNPTSNFVDALYKAVLQPRRAAFEALLKQWLKLWSIEHIKIDSFLHDADDTQLTNMSALLLEIEQIAISYKVVKECISSWLNGQFRLLSRIEKKPEFLMELLGKIRDNFREAAALEKIMRMLETAVENQPDAIIKQIGKQWLGEQRRELRAISTDAASLGFADRGASIASEWKLLGSAFSPLNLVLQQLNPDEYRLTQKNARKLASWNSFEVQRFTNRLSRIIQRRGYLAATTQLSDDGDALEAPPMEDVQRLRENRPQLPESDSYDTIQDYLEKLKQTSQAVDEWLQQFNETSAHLQVMHGRWRDLGVRHGLESIVATLDTVDLEPTTLSQVIQIHNLLVRAMIEIQEILKESLSAEEQQVLEALLRHINQGRERIDALDLAAEIPNDDVLSLLSNLAQQGIVKLEVVP